jgi:tripartite-type tricarboxylate transporter receptor subunit TctC
MSEAIRSPVQIIIGFPPGGSSGTVRASSRTDSRLARAASRRRNKPGAGSVTGSVFARAPKDGYTLAGDRGTFDAAAMRKQLPFDAVRDFTWISTVTTYPFVIATAPGAPYGSLAELIAAAKAAPGKITYSSAGVGTSHHLLGEWLNAEAGIDLVHVPFKGGTSPHESCRARRHHVRDDDPDAAADQSGKLKALAVTAPVGRLPARRAGGRPDCRFVRSAGSASPGRIFRPVLDRIGAIARVKVSA